MNDFDYSDEFLEHIAEVFKAFAHLTRLQILRELHREMAAGGDGVSVQELQEAVGTSQANISKHLNFMADQGLVEARKEGTSRKYVIASEDVMMICDYVCGYMEKRFDNLGSLPNSTSTEDQ
ncbi:MAG: ArsR/SmtB family transcription factor [bacterium]